jgi:putative peptidoglycan lipid II flippase
LLVLAAPAAVIGGITQINLVIGQIIASAKPGAISVLQYADRVYQLPLGVVGVAVGVVLLPELARALKAQHFREAATLQNRSAEFALFMTLPAAAALWVMSPEIVNVLYQRGAFLPETTSKVAGALAIFGLGLPAFVLIKAFTPGFFAREDTRTPMKFAAISVAINTALAISLFPVLAERGIAIAEACAGWTNATLLFVTLARRGHWTTDEGLRRRLPRLAAAAALTGFGLWFAVRQVSAYFSTEAGFLTKAAMLAVLVCGGAVAYFVLAFALGGADRAMLARNLARKPKPAAAD